MVKLADILKEVSALEESLTKTASAKTSKGTSLANTLDKIAEEVSESEEEEKEEEDEKEEGDEEAMKEGSVKLTANAIKKIASEVVAQLSKIAVADTPETQGSVVGAVTGGGQDGAATNAARDTDQVIEGTSVENAANSNPNAHQPPANNGVGDLIVNAPPVPDGLQNPGLGGVGAKSASVVYSKQDAEVLQKLAGVGYEFLVEYYSDKIVQEKVAEAITAEQAKDAPQKIAKAILKGQEKTAAQKSEAQKLAAIKKNDPELFKALQTLANRNLI